MKYGPIRQSIQFLGKPKITRSPRQLVIIAISLIEGLGWSRVITPLFSPMNRALSVGGKFVEFYASLVPKFQDVARLTFQCFADCVQRR
jgi:hypothetical protein